MDDESTFFADIFSRRTSRGRLDLNAIFNARIPRSGPTSEQQASANALALASKYCFVSQKRRYLKLMSIHHWQLRDLVQCSTNDDIFYVYKKSVFKGTKGDRKTTIYIDLSFEPTCIAQAHGLLAVGGKSSELVIKDTQTDQIKFQVNIGGEINNSVCISKPNPTSDTHILIANNDKTVKIFNISPIGASPSSTAIHHHLDPIAILRYPIAMNNCSVSPDGKFMIAVGDSRDVYVHGINQDRTQYHRMYTVSQAKDAGFSCSWNSSSTQYAVASQDGTVAVWDVRSQKVLAKLHSIKSTNYACRCVKFSPYGVMDLLAFTEHNSYVHVVDARNFIDEQIIKVMQDAEPQDISGLCFSSHSNKLYIGTTSSLVEYDIDSVSRRCFSDGERI